MASGKSPLVLSDLTPRDEADFPKEEEGDSQSLTSSTTSITESIFDYRRLHGRLYNADYWAPVDQTQNEAFDLLHHVHLIIAGDKLFLSPVVDESNKDQKLEILDIGTGTGIWALDVAQELPNASVTGTDLVTTQPAWVPPNCRFVIEDASKPWTFPLNHFDLIHARALYGSIPDHKDFYAQAYARVKPGGYFEHVEREVRMESDYATLGPDHVFNVWAEIFYKAGEKMGRSFAIAQGHKMKTLMEEAGFEDVYERKMRMPLHGWPKDPKLRNAGYMGQLAMEQGLEGLGIHVLTQVEGWTHEQALASVAEYRKEMRKLSNYGWCWT